MIKSINQLVRKFEYKVYTTKHGMDIRGWFVLEDFSYTTCCTNNNLGKWWS